MASFLILLRYNKKGRKTSPTKQGYKDRVLFKESICSQLLGLSLFFFFFKFGSYLRFRIPSALAGFILGKQKEGEDLKETSFLYKGFEVHGLYLSHLSSQVVL